MKEFEEKLKIVERCIDRMEQFKKNDPNVSTEVLLYAWSDNFEYTSKPIMSTESLRCLLDLARKGAESI